MVRFVAFFRAINVGGHAAISMQVARKLLESRACKNVESVGNTGNFLFDTEKKEEIIKKDIASAFSKKLGIATHIALRRKEELQALLVQNPFQKHEGEERKYVTFLCEKTNGTLPKSSKRKDIECISFDGLQACCIARKVGGKIEYPNAFVERELRVHATTRNWNVVQKIAMKE